MLYKNISCSVKTFYGVEFKPGEIKEVPGYINSPMMIVSTEAEHKHAVEQSKPSSDKSRKLSKESVVIHTEKINEDEKKLAED